MESLPAEYIADPHGYAANIHRRLFAPSLVKDIGFVSEKELAAIKKERAEIAAAKASRTRPQQIQRIVADNYGITVLDMLSDSKRNVFVFPRQVSMHLIRKLLGFSWRQISHWHGYAEHTTALYSHNKIQKLRKADEELDARLTMIEGEIRKQLG